RQRSGGVEKYSLIASRQAPEHGSTASSPGPDSRSLRQDLRRDVLGAVDADPGAEHSAACAVATRLVRCQSDALARHARVTLSLILCASLASFAPAQRVRPFWTESRRPVRGSPRRTLKRCCGLQLLSRSTSDEMAKTTGRGARPRESSSIADVGSRITPRGPHGPRYTARSPQEGSGRRTGAEGEPQNGRS